MGKQTQSTDACPLISACDAGELGVFLRAECNVSAIASQIVAKDSTATISAAADSARHRGFSFHGNDSSGPGALSSHSERFIQRIDDAVQQIDRVMTDHVSENHSSLLDRVGSVDGLQKSVADIQSSVDHVKSAVNELEATVRQHHDRLQIDIHKHRNVEQCGELVRRLLRFHQLSERVQLAFSANGHSSAKDKEHNPELVPTAVALKEIESLTADPQFEELTIVRQAMPTIRRIATVIRRDVRSSLKDGVQRLSQVDIGDSLQILFYLGSLSDTVQTAVNDVIQEVERECGAAIAEEMLISRVATPAGAGDNNGGAVTIQKADVWKAIHDVFDVVWVHAMQVWNLQRVLAKMVDPATSKSYLDMVIEKDEPSLFVTFWEVSCAIVRELFTGTLSYGAAVKTVLIASYPRMREEANRVLSELHVATTAKGEDVPSQESGSRRDALAAIGALRGERDQLLDAMASLGEAFMERSLRRISNPIQMMFPQSSNFHTSPPSRSDMQTLARTMYSELEQAGRDVVLLEQITQQIRKSVDLFCANSKKIMNNAKAISALTPSCGRTAAQAHNVALLSALQQLEDMIGELETRLNATAGTTQAGPAESSRQEGSGSTSTDTLHGHVRSLIEKELAPCHTQIRDLQFTILGQYLQVLVSLLESILSRMHDESFAEPIKAVTSSRASQASTQPTSGSKYMNDFSATFGVVVEEHIRRLPSAPCVTLCVRDFVSRLMSNFIRHASLLRPLEENGKLRLASDMAQLELRLESVLPLRSLGAPYEELRAFRHMLFLDSSSIVRDSMIDKIRPSNVWHHLIARGPIEMQLPHQQKRWTVVKYIDWLATTACFPPSVEVMTAKLSTVPLGQPSLKEPKMAVQAEKEAWKEITKCLDAYAQRISAVAHAEVSPIFELLQDSGVILLAGYELAVSK